MSEEESVDDDKEAKSEKGSGLDTVERLNKMGGKDGLLERLFGGSVDILGGKLTALTAWAFEERQANTRSHVEAVQAKNPELIDITPNLKTIEYFHEWQKKAENVGPDDADAALWRGILEDILRGEDRFQSDIIDIAKKIDAKDFEILRKVRQGGIRITHDARIDRLIRLGLIQISTSNMILGQSLLLGSLFAIAYLLKFVSDYVVGDGSLDAAIGAAMLMLFPTFLLFTSIRMIRWRKERAQSRARLLKERVLSASERYYDYYFNANYAEISPVGRILMEMTDRYS
ncbi:hypothetical protein [Roseibium aggregatum]|uniref:Uncharacterized protein n=1 Tax=Roseibium aggregatum TaxID=187304 RepID=A0A0M6Y6J1_9HYPH|nr:hypothetical protein [Roseibium aggregatum]CTQ45712.1 hypothetical protein LAL4801_04167 [Roseibium aggregatum]